MGGKHSQEELNGLRQQAFTMELSMEELQAKLREAYIDYDVKSITKISEGGQATVFRIKCKVDHQFYAIKKFKHNFLDPKIDRIHREKIFREIENLRQLNHPNIAKIVDLVKHNKVPVIVMELCDGSLQDILDQNKGKQIPEKDILFIFKQIC